MLGQAVEGVGKLIASLDHLTGALDPATVSATTGELTAAADRLRALPLRHETRRGAVGRLNAMGAKFTWQLLTCGHRAPKQFSRVDVTSERTGERSSI